MDLLSFLNLLLDSPVTTSLIMKYNNGTAQPNMSARNFESFLLPIPPLAEQRRIVAKVDELMPLVGDGMGRETKNEGRRTNE
jgi:type I restriction enzyme S subunit